MDENISKNRRKKVRQISLFIFVLVAAVIWLFPKPIVRKPSDSYVAFIWYRADYEDKLSPYYVRGQFDSTVHWDFANADIDEQGLLELLNQAKAIGPLIAPDLRANVFAEGRVTFHFLVDDGGVSKTILLGDTNRLTVRSSQFSYYHILNSDDLLPKVLTLLGIDEAS